MRINRLLTSMPRLNVYLSDEVYELANRWRDHANLSEICASAIKDELAAAEGSRTFSKALARIRPASQMESALLRKFSLADVLLTTSPQEPNDLRDNLGRAAAEYLDRNICDGSRIAIAGGRQMWCMVQHLSPRRVRAAICALGMHAADPQLLHVHPNTLATLIWLLYSPRSKAYVLGSSGPLPSWTGLPIKTHPSYFVISSCSRFQENSPFADLLGANVSSELMAHGILGDYGYIFFDQTGNIIESPKIGTEFRLPADVLKDLSNRRDARIVLVAGGVAKLEVIRTTLTRRLCNTLICDDATAERLLE